jgi:hypothetical protein
MSDSTGKAFTPFTTNTSLRIRDHIVVDFVGNSVKQVLSGRYIESITCQF